VHLRKCKMTEKKTITKDKKGVVYPYSLSFHRKTRIRPKKLLSIPIPIPTPIHSTPIPFLLTPTIYLLQLSPPNLSRLPHYRQQTCRPLKKNSNPAQRQEHQCHTTAGKNKTNSSNPSRFTADGAQGEGSWHTWQGQAFET
jgi:hypothetical protein